MKKKITIAPISLPDDELVWSWIKHKPEQVSLFHEYQALPSPLSSDADWQITKPPVLPWPQYIYREHELNWPAHEHTHRAPYNILSLAHKRKHEALIHVAANKRTYLSIPAQHEYSEPVQLHTRVAQGDIVLEEIVIVIGSDAHVTLYDTSTSDEHENFLGRSVQVILESGAQLTYVVDQQILSATKMLYFLSVYVDHQAQFQGYVLDSGGMYRRYYLDMHLQGAYGQARLRSISRASGNEQVDVVSRQYHTSSHALSSLHIRSLVSGQAGMNYKGLIHIDERSLATEAEQYSMTLLLSAHARAVALPSLEVSTNEVQCRHGSALGTLQADEIFYLQARGLSTQQATQILLQAFICHDMPAELSHKLITFMAPL